MQIRFTVIFLPPPSTSPLSLSPNYVSLYQLRHRWIGRSEAGNDFFFCLMSALRKIRVALVIRSFITLPARHSAVGGNAISPDSHNYPKIERGKRGGKKNLSKQNCGSGRVYIWGSNCRFVQRERGRKRVCFHLLPCFWDLTFLEFCLLESESFIESVFQTCSTGGSFVLHQTGRSDDLIEQCSATYLPPAVGAAGLLQGGLLLLLSSPLQLEPQNARETGRSCTWEGRAVGLNGGTTEADF